ncbi:hypothetical protein AVEN_5066-1 [Araneus ventricosus]|uniref:Uncharacterized protein n=1 Tax=Araneus ventricosus TaxID=182803 RepID=A0A4Y2LF99_ARAVE|nr:hypothetical protein AVEN_5066-1 [Araneus ventricosus]
MWTILQSAQFPAAIPPTQSTKEREDSLRNHRNATSSLYNREDLEEDSRRFQPATTLTQNSVLTSLTNCSGSYTILFVTSLLQCGNDLESV